MLKQQRRLRLDKQTIRTLSDLGEARGGAPRTPQTCNNSDCYSCDPSIVDPRFL
jgi:hypothetical protein